MDSGTVIAVIICALVGLSVILLFHHRYSHREGSAHELHGCNAWFQKSDVGNCHSCSHEMWIIGIMCLALVLSSYLAIYQVLIPWLSTSTSA
jgi:hypothetical protein